MLRIVIKTVNYIGGHAFNTHQFSQFSDHIDYLFIDVPLDTDVRWLSCLKEPKRFYLLRQEIVKFLEMKSQNTDEIKVVSELWILLWILLLNQLILNYKLKTNPSLNCMIKSSASLQKSAHGCLSYQMKI